MLGEQLKILSALDGEIYDPDKGVPSMLEILDGRPPATTTPVRVESSNS
jgi:hypothetical protein